jgi:hypothetical protein
MKPLICPQCGGTITEYSPRDRFAICGYCATRFLIEPQKTEPAYQTAPVAEAPRISDINSNVLIGIIVAVGVIFGGVFLLALKLGGKKPKPDYPIYTAPSRPTATVLPTPTPIPNLLEFGGKGTGEGMFQNADSIAVDARGRIYVADETLRVQQFDENGEFLKLWQIPSETQFYKRARSIQKIAIDAEDRLHVLIGGVIFVYRNDASEPQKAVYFSPDAILDFAIRSDGSRLFVVADDRIETLYHVSEKGKTLKKIVGFHTNTADAALSPRETGLAAIRLAIDGAGNIYSIYAFGDLGSYELRYNSDELMIFRFTPEGKYVNKFVETMNSCCIEVDNQSRIYITDQISISAYTNTGQFAASVNGLPGIDAFVLDKQNNVYILHDDRVIKRPAIQ